MVKRPLYNRCSSFRVGCPRLGMVSPLPASVGDAGRRGLRVWLKRRQEAGVRDICGSLDHVEGQRIAIGREGREAGAVYSYLRASDAAAPHCHRAAYSGLDAGFLMVSPPSAQINIYSVTANSFQALDLTRAPCRRESRQKVDALLGGSEAASPPYRQWRQSCRLFGRERANRRDYSRFRLYIGLRHRRWSGAGHCAVFCGHGRRRERVPVIDLPSHRPSCRGVAAEFERVNSGSKPWAVDIDLIGTDRGP